MKNSGMKPAGPGWKRRLYTVIFESETFAGKAFDVALLVAILLSVIVVMLESVGAIRARHERELIILEWVFTGLFTIEYLLRLACSPNRLRYATSFFGVIDLLAILPTYLTLLFSGAHYLMAIRILRLLRVFRIFKLAHFLTEAEMLLSALRASRNKVTVFLGAVVTLVVVMGTLMYVVEGEQRGFTSIPQSVYWAVVTLTTVGYGDMSPKTPLGQFIACVVMVMGYGIIAVPTGIFSVELTRAAQASRRKQTCGSCGASDHNSDSVFCRHCGQRLANG